MKDGRGWVELHARSCYSFLRGAALPEELAEEAARLGLGGMAVCDRMGVYGAPRFYGAARESGVRPWVGAELAMEDGTVVPVLVASREGYRNLCRLLTEAHFRAEKGKGRVAWTDLVPEAVTGLLCLTGDEEGPLARAHERGDRAGMEGLLRRLQAAFGKDGVWVEVQRRRVRGEERRVEALWGLADALGVPVVATGGVRFATRDQRGLMDALTCLRHRTHLDAAGRLLEVNEEGCVKSEGVMRGLFADRPDAVEQAVVVAERLEFTLEDLGYAFPEYRVPEGETMDSFLAATTWRLARERYGGELSGAVRAQLERELTLIGKLGFSGYFLIVWDLVNFCRQEGILVQGRGSAANSAVCYSLGITAVDPVGAKLLFERFLSEGRKGWPDIDLDLPSGERRERVIQEVYRRYGRRGAAMTANGITFRGRSAAREMGKVLNLPTDLLDRFSDLFAHGDYPQTLELEEQVRRAGLPLDHPRAGVFLELYRRVYGRPRHLGQHSGGMILSQGRLDEVVPLEPAAMEGRTVAQWDKDDCEDLGIIKVDLLGLGMLAAMQDALAELRALGRPVDLARIPKDDEATFELMQRADTVGVFQIESRAQMATLPRMKPATFYDLVIEVAIIRPGPIQGRLTHPYLARRMGREPVRYIDEALRPLLERTLGVPLFQEQVLQMAMVMADFSGQEAEELRRALSYHRSQDRMSKVERKLREALERKGWSREVAEEVVAAVTSFALYGFPESHAISFALITYASAWLKVHEPAAFYAALLNNQPMGFYRPPTLVRDAKAHGVRVLPVCVERSVWDCRVEPGEAGEGVRLGFRMVRGLRKEVADRLEAGRAGGAFQSVEDVQVRCGLEVGAMRSLAAVGAFAALGAGRREGLWQAELPLGGELWQGRRGEAREVGKLRPMTAAERLAADYEGLGLTIGQHPMGYIRKRVPDLWRAKDLAQGEPGVRVRIGGQVICRQRPGTAKGVVFVSVEDETGVANGIVSPELFESERLTVVQEPFLVLEGVLQRVDGVTHVRVERIERLPFPVHLGVGSHDFH
ncbi:MAG: error-prone DNA polymerase [Verrucomicrobiia bacterium]